MKQILFTLMMLCVASSLCHAQDDISSKLSFTTQMFLNDRDCKKVLHRRVSANTTTKTTSDNEDANLIMNLFEDNFYAEPEVYDGVAYISAFIRLYDDANTEELESKGVEIH